MHLSTRIFSYDSAKHLSWRTQYMMRRPLPVELLVEMARILGIP
jgi:hypothetical protein